MGDFLAELRRRHIFRIGGVYVVAAWGIAQIVDLLSQTFALPDWIAQPLLVVLAVGLPITLIASWMVVGAAKSGNTPAELKKATATDWVLASALIAVLAFMGYQQLLPSSVSTEISNASESASAGEATQEGNAPLENSIAVLPLENLSPDPDRAYFAAGIHEEIISQLAKISDLNVIARTSVMDYPESGKSIPEIADELNVEMIMEGSVRYAGDAIRVTAQLIDGRSNTHLWTETYDGELSDIFGIQADIATRIANALQADLLDSEREQIGSAYTSVPDAYAAYLRGIAVVQQGYVGSGTSARTRALIQTYLDEALELDPDFALAHAWKAYVYANSRFYDQVDDADWLEFKSEMDRLVDYHAELALLLDPNIGLAHAARAHMHFNNWNARLAELEAERAIRLSPNDPEVLMLYSHITGYIRAQFDDAVSYVERAVELDPNNVRARWQLGMKLLFAGRFAEASNSANQCLELDPTATECAMRLARSEFVQGNQESSLRALELVERLPEVTFNQFELVYGLSLLGQPNQAQELLARLTQSQENSHIDPTEMCLLYLAVGNTDLAIEQLELAIENRDLLQSPYTAIYLSLNYWSDPVLERPEFVDVRTRLAFSS